MNIAALVNHAQFKILLILLWIFQQVIIIAQYIS